MHEANVKSVVLPLALWLCATAGALADEAIHHETIVFMRHGEKPKDGLGQLDCQGFNRALALPKVLEAKFGKPAAIFAPDPSKTKKDGGQDYDYIRPLATIEPTAIQFGLPVDTNYGFAEIDKLKDALEQPAYRDATIFVAWEHKLIDVLVKELMKEHGGSEDTVPKWHGSDFDSLYVVTITSGSTQPAIGLTIDHEGLDGQQTSCPN